MRALAAASQSPQRDHERPTLTRLPPELQDEIFSYLPSEGLSCVRRSSKKLHAAVAKYETSITQRTIKFHIARLQASIDKINATKFPTDVDSFLACMRTWTSTRGSFRDPELSLDSYNKWFSHLAGGRPMARNGRREKKFQRWAMLTSVTTCLQRRVNVLASQKIDFIDDEDDLELWEWFSQENMGYKCPLDDDGLLELFERIKETRDGECDISGRWHTAKKERSTFPSDKIEKMTRGDYARERRREMARLKYSKPMPERPSEPKIYGRFRLTPILSNLKAKSEGRDGMKYPVRPADIMCANLGLPTLPGNNTFCYYVTKTWVFEKLSKSHPKAIEMGPSMIAAALASVEIF